jgi:excisionase family DNA binding protein
VLAAPPSFQTPELLTVRQVAEILGVSLGFIWKLARQGDLRPVRLRGCTRWRRADILRFIDSLPTDQDKEAAHE